MMRMRETNPHPHLPSPRGAARRYNLSILDRAQTTSTRSACMCLRPRPRHSVLPRGEVEDEEGGKPLASFDERCRVGGGDRGCGDRGLGDKGCGAG